MTEEIKKNKLYSRLEQNTEKRDAPSSYYYTLEDLYGAGQLDRMATLQAQRNQMVNEQLRRYVVDDQFLMPGITRRVKKKNIFWRFITWFGKTVDEIKKKIELQILFKRYQRRVRRLEMDHPTYIVNTDYAVNTDIPELSSELRDYRDMSGGTNE